eukprot:2872812-Prymnesium_polylepis.1
MFLEFEMLISGRHRLAIVLPRVLARGGAAAPTSERSARRHAVRRRPIRTAAHILIFLLRL